MRWPVTNLQLVLCLHHLEIVVVACDHRVLVVVLLVVLLALGVQLRGKLIAFVLGAISTRALLILLSNCSHQDTRRCSIRLASTASNRASTRASMCSSAI